MRSRQWHNEMGPFAGGKTWRQSVLIPSLICDACWLPFRLSRWLVKMIWRFFLFILTSLAVTTAIVALSYIASGGTEYKKLFAVIFFCAIVGGGFLLSDALKSLR